MSEDARIEQLRRENEALRRAVVSLAVAQSDAFLALAEAAMDVAQGGTGEGRVSARKAVEASHIAAQQVLDAVEPVLIPG